MNRLPFRNPEFTLNNLLVAFVVTIGGGLIYGYHLTLLNNPKTEIDAFINESYMAHYDKHPSEQQVLIINTLASALYVGFGIIGSAPVGLIASRFGRKRPMFVFAVLGALGTIFMTTSLPVNSFELLLVARCLMGFHGGLQMGFSPMYVSECSPTAYRGFFTIIVSVGITFGAFLGAALSLSKVLGSRPLLPVLFALPLIPIILNFIGMIFFPESPRFLLERRENEKAQKALQFLRNRVDVENEIQGTVKEIESSDAAEDGQKISVLDLIRSSRWKLMLLTAVMCQTGQQLSGVNAIIFYSSATFQDAGLSIEQAGYGTVGINLMLFTCNCVAMLVVEKIGRRPLMLFGFLVMSIMSFMITPFLTYAHSHYAFAILSIVCSIIFIGAFSLGPSGISWFIASEMFPQEARPAAVSFTASLNWLSNLLIVASFPFVQKLLKSYTFIIFGVSNAIYFLYLFFFLCETKSKTTTEIEEAYARKLHRTAQ